MKYHAIFNFQRRNLIGVAVASCLALLHGCQTDGSSPPAVSLEEAKAATASFDNKSLVVPPRTVVDVTEILDRPMRRDAAEKAALAEARATAAKKPPAGADGTELANFLWDRAHAAFAIGDERQYLDDLKSAFAILEATPSGAPADLSWDLGSAEVFAGNHANGRRLRERGAEGASSLGRQASRTSVVALSYLSVGDLAGATRKIESVEQILNSANFRRSTNGIEATLARTKATYATVTGEYREAERLLRKARDLIRGNDTNGRRTVLIQSDLALAIMHQGRLVEAEIEARTALTQSLQRFGRTSSMTSRMIIWLSRVVEAQGRAEDTERLVRAAIDTYDRAGVPKNSWRRADARATLARAIIAQRRWKDAAAEYDRIETILAGDHTIFEQRFAHDPGWALSLVRSGDAAKGLAIARKGVERRLRLLGAKHYDTAEARGVLAMALAANGDAAAALDAFGNAVPILLQRSRVSEGEQSSQTSRAFWRQLILGSYIAVLGRSGRPGDAEEAFRISQATRSQSVERALAASSARAAARDPSLADLARREQDALKRIGALNALLATRVGIAADQQDAAALRDVRGKIDRLRGARAVLAQEIERRFPAYASLMTPKPATIGDARAALHRGEALIATYVGENETHVWAVPKTGPIQFTVAPLGRERMAAVVRNLRRALDPRAATLGEIPAYDVRLSHRLYKALLEPVAAGWRDAESLLVVAHGPLGQLPFSVLVTDAKPLPADQAPLFSNYRNVAWLARSHAVTVLPSVGSLATLRQLPPSSPRRLGFVGFGDPWFSIAQAAEAASGSGAKTTTASLVSRGLLAVRGRPVALRAAPRLDGVSSAGIATLPRLPDTAEEVRAIGVALKADLTRDVFTGKRASEGRVKSMTLSRYKVLAFATHGLVPGDLDGLSQPVLALSAPAVAGGDDDGLLTMGEILGLKLDADWVVLSACNTASGAGAGAEAVSGLGRAFFYAGTRALLAFNWPVETTSARALTTDLFDRQSGNAALTRAAALRRSMAALMDGPGFTNVQGKSVFSYAHPIFWAPFSLIGDGGGAQPAS